jgi:hypothetical protein
MHIVVLPALGKLGIAQLAVIVASHMEQSITEYAVLLRGEQCLYSRVLGDVLYFVVDIGAALLQWQELRTARSGLYGIDPCVTSLRNHHASIAEEVRGTQPICSSRIFRLVLDDALGRHELSHLFDLTRLVPLKAIALFRCVDDRLDLGQDVLTHRAAQLSRDRRSLDDGRRTGASG